jgi:hypothetical protein
LNCMNKEKINGEIYEEEDDKKKELVIRWEGREKKKKD